MYRLLIFGTGSTCDLLEQHLKDDVCIVGYIDNDVEKQGKLKRNLHIEAPRNINKFSYDCIAIASQFNESIYNQLLELGVQRHKIFQFFKFTDLNFNYIKYRIDNFIYKQTKESVEVFITGLSYCLCGIDTKRLIKRALNLAFGSQDLFYDYYLIKYLLNKSLDKIINVRHIIIGLSYYSFEYDMSLSAMKNKTVLYYPIVGTAHHFKNINNVFEEYSYNVALAQNIIKKNEKGGYLINWNKSTSSIVVDSDVKGRKQAESDSNKNYPKTVKENKQIFKDYLQLLIENNIKPIVVVFPASRYYTKYFSKRIEDEFHSIISEVKQEYKFQYIDYFRSDLFNDDDFQDASHLNPRGAEKFTKILNEIIEW